MDPADGMFGLRWPGYGYNNQHLKHGDVSDGTSNTLGVGETTYNYKDYVWSSYYGTELAGQPKLGTAR